MAYKPPANPQNPDVVARQMVMDPRVQDAYARYQDTHDQAAFVAYLDTIKPYTSQIDQSKYGIDPETGLFRGTSNYGHWWKLGAGMAAGAALPYGPWANAATSSGQAAANRTGQYTDTETPGTVNVDSGGGKNPLASIGSQVGNKLVDAGFRALSGLPALFANRDPSPQESAFTDQARRLLGQQEQRTQFQNPLYAAATRSAYSLLPQGATQGNPFPYNSLSDVNVPGLEDLLNAQRTAQRK